MDKVLFFLVIICCFPNILYSAVVTHNNNPPKEGTLKIDEKCSRDIHCIENAYCYLQKICVCDDAYFADEDKTMCHEAVGTQCQSNDTMACSTMSNGECVDGLCVCQENYYLDQTNKSNCFIKPTSDNDFCQENSQCSDSFNNSYCESNKCQCFADHIFVKEVEECIHTRGHYQPCKHDYECYDEELKESLYCIDFQCDFIRKEEIGRAAVHDPNEPDGGSTLVPSFITIGFNLFIFYYLNTNN